jgi:hypothetical protein
LSSSSAASMSRRCIRCRILESRCPDCHAFCRGECSSSLCLCSRH